MLAVLKNVSYLPSFIIAITIVGVFLYKTIRIFFREGVVQHIKDDWTHRLPYKIRYNRYRGASRPSYVLLCCIYYPIKDLFLIVLAFEIYVIKFVVWDIWVWLFRSKNKVLHAKREHTAWSAKNDSESVDDPEGDSTRCISKTEIADLWHNGDEDMWHAALGRYWSRFTTDQYRLEKEIENICISDIASLSVCEFYDFLYQQYYPWKFTNKLFLSRNRKHLEKYLLNDEIECLAQIQTHLLNLDLANIKECLSVASSIHGLGTAGASGLLSILYPEYFGTVDRFVVYSLLEIDGLQEHETLSKMNPEALNLNDGVALIEIMRKKAKELNNRFDTDFWTPRKIDMILWAVR